MTGISQISLCLKRSEILGGREPLLCDHKCHAPYSQPLLHLGLYISLTSLPCQKNQHVLEQLLCQLHPVVSITHGTHTRMACTLLRILQRLRLRAQLHVAHHGSELEIALLLGHSSKCMTCLLHHPDQPVAALPGSSGEQPHEHALLGG